MAGFSTGCESWWSRALARRAAARVLTAEGCGCPVTRLCALAGLTPLDASAAAAGRTAEPPAAAFTDALVLVTRADTEAPAPAAPTFTFTVGEAETSTESDPETAAAAS